MEHYTHYVKKLNDLFQEKGNEAVFKIMNPQGEIRKITYDFLFSQMEQFKQRLDEMEIEPGDSVLLIDSHTPSIMQMFLMTTYWNITPVLMDPGLPVSEIDALINDLDLKAIFTSKSTLKRLSDNVKKEIPTYDIENYHQLEEAPLRKGTIKGNLETCIIILSSGTTNTTKPIEISYGAILKGIEQNIKLSGARKGENMLLAFPLFHVSGLNSALAVLFFGNMLMMVDEFYPSMLPQMLKTFEPHIFGMVPRVFEIMVQKFHTELSKKSQFIQGYYRVAFAMASFFNRKFGMTIVGRVLLRSFAKSIFAKNIRVLVVGTSACNPNTAETLINMGLRWFYVYASTECGVPITAVTKYDHYPCDTVGRVDSVDGVEIIIKNPDVHGVGEIYVKTDQIMTGYFGDEELTRKSFEQGYFKTGDSGYIDHKGYLHITGRTKETILLQTGKKIAPTDLEMVLEKANLSCQVAICGVPDADKGFDQIHAFVCDANYSEEERKQHKEAIKKAFLKEASQYTISDIHFVKEIPRTAVGKVKRNQLKDELNLKSEYKATAQKSKSLKYKGSSHEELCQWILSLFAGESGQNDNLYKKPWKELGEIDSLRVLEILDVIEEETGVYIGEKIVSLKTATDIALYIAKESKNNEKN